MLKPIATLWDFSEDIYVELENCMIEDLVERIHKKYGSWRNVAAVLGCDETTIRKSINRNLVSVHLLKRIIEIIGNDDIEGCVVGITKPPFFTKLKIKATIFPSPEIASILGHCFGDGSLSNQFKYSNTSEESLRHLNGTIVSVFGNVNFCKNSGSGSVITYTYPTIVGSVLKLCGGVVGNRMNCEFGVPRWIRTGDEAIKIAFLKALYDDEGCVVVGSKVIQLKLCKNEIYKKSFELFLNELKDMLFDLGIRAKIVYSSYKNNKIEGVIKIYGYENIKRFSMSIGFTIKNKDEKIKRLLCSYKRMISEHGLLTDKIREDFAHCLTNKEIAQKYNKRYSTIIYHLNKIRGR